MNPAIKIDKVSKKFRKTMALDSVSFEVPSGSIFALLGDNGAGKTTLIKSMLGFVHPDQGRVEVLGMNAKKRDHQIRSRVGFVPEQPELYEWMRVDEIGWFVAGIRQDNFYEKYKQQISSFGIPLDKRISELSKGMKAKISLALATSHEPEVLILDEPTSGLDPLIRREFMESMVDEAARGTTVFLSSHQLNEVERVAEHVAVLQGGQLLFVEPLASLKQNTAQLLITTSDADRPDLDIPATIIHCQAQGRQQRILIRDFESNQELIEQILQKDEVDACEMTHPSLEEIFVGYLSPHHVGSQESDAASVPA